MAMQSADLNPRLEEKMRLEKCWIWFLILGIVLILLGIVALGSPFVVAVTSVLLFGCLLLGGGVVQIVNAVLARSWRGFFVHLLAGVVHLLLGGLMVEQPARAAVDLTLVLALAFVIGGALRIIHCLIERFPDWQWVLLNGAVTLVLGIAIWRRWPEASYWVIGTFVGIDLIFNGWSWVMLAFVVKAPAPGSATPALSGRQ
jgi:uncharacterized membrane protein HdeD (DUF308 family)